LTKQLRIKNAKIKKKANKPRAVEPHCFSADPEPDPAQNLEPDPDPDLGGGKVSQQCASPLAKS
jgi:hypothetical protein